MLTFESIVVFIGAFEASRSHAHYNELDCIIIPICTDVYISKLITKMLSSLYILATAYESDRIGSVEICCCFNLPSAKTFF